jgi:hypothetical protein
MTSIDFKDTFSGPANKHNREVICKSLGITRFAGVPLKSVGWTGRKNAVGDYFNLDVRNFVCEAAFESALATKLESLVTRIQG